MAKVRFKNYPGISPLDGSRVVFDCSDFDAGDLRRMLEQPLHLKKVNFQTGHQIWAEHTNYVLECGTDAEKSYFIGLGMPRALATLGYRVFPEPPEIEISEETLTY